MNRLLAAAALVALVGVPTHSSAQSKPSPREKLVVTSAWLAEHLNDRDLVILPAGRKATYEAGHIPGARLVHFDAGALAAPMDHSGRSPDHVMLEMPATQSLH